jgi:5-formyltetrahydrofolate cyclo-ligase
MTTIHPLQVVDDRIPMRAHDIPVDFMIMPDQVVAAPSLYPRPRGILWDLLPDERIRAIPILRKGRRDAAGSRSPGYP